MNPSPKAIMLVGGAVLLLAGVVFFSFQQTDAVSYARSGLSVVEEPAYSSSVNDNSPTTTSWSERFNRVPDTEDLSRSFMASYLQSRSSQNDPLSRDDQEALARNLYAAYNEEYENNLPTYQPDDFNQEEATKETARAYGNKLGEFLVINTPDELVNELEVFVESLNQNDSDKLKGLDPIIEGYEGFVNSLRNMTVPADAVNTHAELVTSADRHLLHLVSLRNIYDDPISAMKGLRDFSDGVKALEKAFQKLEEYFESYDITFQHNEYGWAVVNTI